MSCVEVVLAKGKADNIQEIQKTGEPEEQQDDLHVFLDMLRTKTFNGKAGNKSLRDALGWSADPDRYWHAHGRAVDQGFVETARGKGGSVKLVNASAEAIEDDSSRRGKDETDQREKELYEPTRKVLYEGWGKAENYDDYLVSITATRGRAKTGGKWTRPDVSVVASKAYPYLPQRYFEIVTFEVKPANQITVEGVFEALSHQQFATRSYVIFHVPELQAQENFLEKYDDAPRIVSTARKHGIGIILATNIADWETWDEVLGAERVLPDPEQANRFIATGFSAEIRDQIIKWHK